MFFFLHTITRACNAIQCNCDDFIFNEENTAPFCLFECLKKSLCRSFCLSFTHLMAFVDCGFVIIEIFGFVKRTCAI